MPNDLLTIALQDDGSVVIRLAEGKEINSRDLMHGQAMMLASIYKQIKGIPQSAGASESKCDEIFAETLALAHRYYRQGTSEESATIETRTP